MFGQMRKSGDKSQLALKKDPLSKVDLPQIVVHLADGEIVKHDFNTDTSSRDSREGVTSVAKEHSLQNILTSSSSLGSTELANDAEFVDWLTRSQEEDSHRGSPTPRRAYTSDPERRSSSQSSEASTHSTHSFKSLGGSNESRKEKGIFQGILNALGLDKQTRRKDLVAQQSRAHEQADMERWEARIKERVQRKHRKTSEKATIKQSLGPKVSSSSDGSAPTNYHQHDVMPLSVVNPELLKKLDDDATNSTENTPVAPWEQTTPLVELEKENKLTPRLPCCEECKQELSNITSVQVLDKFFHEICLSKAAWGICNFCHSKILFTQTCIQVPILSRYWHLGCLRCSSCKDDIWSAFFLPEDRPYCSGCYVDQVAPKCSSCTKSIIEIQVKICKKILCNYGREYFNVGGRAICKNDIEARGIRVVN